MPIPRGHVDHAPEADVIVRVHQQAEVGECVLDLLALVEPDAADDLVAEAFPDERVLERARLRVGAIEHADQFRLVLCGKRLSQPLRDEVGLLELVAASEVSDRRTASAIGPEPLLFAIAVLADERRRSVQDHLRRSVVLFQPNDGGLAEVLLEVHDVAQVGAAPFVDGLVRVPDDA